MTMVFAFVQEFEQELEEQKSLLRSVASRGEEILTQHSAAEGSGGLGYVLQACSFLFLLCFVPFEKRAKHLAPVTSTQGIHPLSLCDIKCSRTAKHVVVWIEKWLVIMTNEFNSLDAQHVFPQGHPFSESNGTCVIKLDL